MKNKKTKVTKEKKAKYQTLANRIVILLQNRNDVTRLMLPDLTGKSMEQCDMALTKLRKSGFSIFPSKGAGTPLRIASSQLQSTKYLNWRRAKYLPTMKRMIIAEQVAGESYPALSEKSTELLQIISEATNEI